MVHLVCDCLNLKIHTKGLPKIIQPSDLTLNEKDEEDGKYFFVEQPLSLVSLDIGGITQEQDFLVRIHKLENWQLFSCLNCGTVTHALASNYANGTIVINRNLKDDSNYGKEVQSSDLFSPLFRILLIKKDENVSFGALGSFSPKSASMEAVLARIQQQLNKYLKEEELKMEERIKQYRSQQKMSFAFLQDKAKRDKQDLIGILHQIEDENTQVLPEINFNSITPPRTPDANDQPTTKFIPTNIPLQIKNPSIRAVMRRAGHLNQGRFRKNNGYGTGSADTEGLFDLDGVEDDRVIPELTAYESEIEDPYVNMEEFQFERSSSPLLAKSLPMSVPAMKHFVPVVQDDKSPSPQDAHEIAASIQALAKSVHAHSENIFGDLPRSRVNTFSEH